MRFSVSSPAVKRLIRLAIEEDVGSGDITTKSVVENDARWSVALKVLGEPAVACHLADHLPTTSKVARA